MTFNCSFKIDPVSALVKLEESSYLYSPIAENSPLRRIIDKDKNSLKLDLFFHSKKLEAYLEKKKTTQVPEFFYIARKGLNFNGHSLATKVLSSGNIFIGEPDEIFKLSDKDSVSQDWFTSILNHPFFKGVNSTETALELLINKVSEISEDMFRTFAITGTNGKTSLVQNLSWAFEKLSKKKTLKIGTLGIQLNGETHEGTHSTSPDYPTFISALMEAKSLNIKDVFLEVSSHGLKESRIGTFHFDLAIFTNLTQDHLDYHVTMDDYKNSKLLLFKKHLKRNAVAIINTLRENHEDFLNAATHNSELLYLIVEKNSKYLSLKSKKTTLFEVLQTKCSLDASLCEFRMHSERGESYFKFSLTQIGKHQIENALCLIAALHSQGFEMSVILDIISKLPNIPGRLEKVTPRLKKGKFPNVYVDFAHSPDAVESVLKSIRAMKPKNSRLISVMGCGGNRDRSKRPLIGKILEKLSDLTFVTSDNPRDEEPLEIIHDMISTLTKTNHFFINANRKDAIKDAIIKATHEDIILILGKGHENFQIIHGKKH